MAAIVLSVIRGALYGSYAAGSQLNPKVVTAQQLVTVQSTSTPPILLKIIQCESGGKQLDKNGQLLVNINVQADGSKSVDVGIGQVNLELWGATATKMGYDLTKQEDNMAFTLWLFENKGSQPWMSSSKCWIH